MSSKLLIIFLVCLGILAGSAMIASAGSRPPVVTGPQAEHRSEIPGTGQFSSPLVPVGGGFTYQGRLTTSGGPANGQFDLRFTLYDAAAAGNQVGAPITVISHTVSGGLFTVPLDFGSSPFQGSARWMEIEVRQTGGGTFTTLTPRQALTAAPYALSLMPGAVITGTTDANTALLMANNSGNGYGVWGTISSSNGYGVFGTNTAASGGTGVRGSGSASGSGYGVWGDGYYGVLGQSTSSDSMSAGVFGNGYYGVRGLSTSSDSMSAGVSGMGRTGVFGTATSSSGYGVWGQGSNTGIYGESTGSTGGTGVRGIASGSGGSGVRGDGYYGVQGLSTSSDSMSAGVFGLNSSSTNGFGVLGSGYYGVRGQSNSSDSMSAGVSGSGRTGVFGTATSSIGYGVWGQGSNTGIYGESTSSSGGTGVRGTTAGDGYGVWGSANGTIGYGVFGSNTATSGGGSGVFGIGHNGVVGNSSSFDGYGVAGYNDNGGIGGTGGVAIFGSGYRVGVHGTTTGNGGSGVFGTTSSFTGYGVLGRNTDPSVGIGVRGEGSTYGVQGTSSVFGGSGVYGEGSMYGVQGYSALANGIGVEARGNGDNTALQINDGALKVSGDDRPVFVHVATLDNTSGNVTYIDNAFADGDPNAILIVTPNFDPPGGTGGYNNHPIGVYYTGTQWAIFNQDLAPMGVGLGFNVMVVKQ